uniref:Uncharacterized protein n=1 Tax=Glossina brevipalpis TaxID=37001 RepID=A0A1A9X0A3_9MUSC
MQSISDGEKSTIAADGVSSKEDEVANFLSKSHQQNYLFPMLNKREVAPTRYLKYTINCGLRFVILKVVIRKDLIQTLPLPRRLLDYLNYKHCYSEQIESDSSNSQPSAASMHWESKVIDFVQFEEVFCEEDAYNCREELSVQFGSVGIVFACIHVRTNYE